MMNTEKLQRRWVAVVLTTTLAGFNTAESMEEFDKEPLLLRLDAKQDIFFQKKAQGS